MKENTLLKQIVFRVENIISLLPETFHNGNCEVFTLVDKLGNHMLAHNRKYRCDEGYTIERIELFFVRGNGETMHFTYDLSMLTNQMTLMVGKRNELNAVSEYTLVKQMEELMLNEAVKNGWL